MTDLSELLERVTAATGPDRELDGLLAISFPPSGEKRLVLGEATKRYGKFWFENQYIEGSSNSPDLTASVDAALAFAERVLPGWEWLKKSPGIITLYRPLTEQEDAAKAWAKHFDATGATIPLAIIAATLTALIARKDAQ